MESPPVKPITPAQARRNLCLVMVVTLLSTLLLSVVFVGLFLFLVITLAPH